MIRKWIFTTISTRVQPVIIEIAMENILTISEINAHFASEWVLLDEPQTNEASEVLSGNLIYHSPDRDAVYRKAVELRPKHFAVLFTGTIPDGTEVVL